MEHEEILTPVAMYRDRLKAEHAKNTAEAFEELFKLSGVDENANAALVRIIRKLEKLVADLSKKLARWKFFRGLMILLAIAGIVLGVLWLIPVCGGKDFGVEMPVGASGIGAAVLSLVLIFLVLNGKIRTFSEQVDSRKKELQERTDEAWQMMEPLNSLYRWDTVATIVMKTLPILTIDRYVSEQRLEQLIRHFEWSDITDDMRSTIACQSGVVNGNPWVIADELIQSWGVKTYTGTLTIHWEAKEYYTDSDGRSRSRWVTRSEVLVATLDKPIPLYGRKKRLVYGNEAAPKLNFSRDPNPLSSASSGLWGRFRMKRAIAALEKKSRDLDDPFTIMDNREFDACFNAVDRDSEQQFRLLFTPLAQREMLNLLRDGKQGYGDDFAFVKHRMINTLYSEHLDNLDISSGPHIFRHYDLASARKNFNDYGNDFFRVFFFSFAPLFCIPLYQHHRNYEDIYQGVIDSGDAAFCEQESFANALGEEHFRPGNAATRCILKTRIASRLGEGAMLTVTAHAFRTEERVEYVSKYGGDGKWHNVPVHWTEYLPVSGKSGVLFRSAETGDHQEFARKLGTKEWQAWLKALNAGNAAAHFRRGLAAFLR